METNKGGSMKNRYLVILTLISIIFILISGCNINLYDKNKSVYEGYKNFARFELPQNENECKYDSECFVGGCNGETCTAHEPKVTTCDVPEGMQGGLSCKCINRVCIWVKK